MLSRSHSAFQALLPAALGDVGAQTTLGLMYCTGEGVPVDLAKAKEILKLAFDNPDADDTLRRKCESLWDKYKLYAQ